jgi:hypothetical protein
MPGGCSRWSAEVFRREAVYESRKATIARGLLRVAALSVESASEGPRVHCNLALIEYWYSRSVL